MTDQPKKTIVEIGGVKLEVDMRYARRIEEIRIGDRVKVLIKPSYGDMKVSPGIVAGFEILARTAAETPPVSVRR